MYSYIRKVGGFGFIAMIMICVFLSQISFASTTANKKDSEAISNADLKAYRNAILGDYKDLFSCKTFDRSISCSADNASFPNNIHDRDAGPIRFHNIRIDSKITPNIIKNTYSADMISYDRDFERNYKILPTSIMCYDRSKKIRDDIVLSDTSCDIDFMFFSVKLDSTLTYKSDEYRGGNTFDAVTYLYNTSEENTQNIEKKLEKLHITITKKGNFNKLINGIYIGFEGKRLGRIIGDLYSQDELSDRTKESLEKVLSNVRDFLFLPSKLNTLEITLTNTDDNYYKFVVHIPNAYKFREELDSTWEHIKGVLNEFEIDSSVY